MLVDLYLCITYFKKFFLLRFEMQMCHLMNYNYSSLKIDLFWYLIYCMQILILIVSYCKQHHQLYGVFFCVQVFGWIYGWTENIYRGQWQFHMDTSQNHLIKYLQLINSFLWWKLIILYTTPRKQHDSANKGHNWSPARFTVTEDAACMPF